MGIIPADAGITDWEPGTPWRTEDHPRGCGEHQLAKDNALTNSGSSPRMRGARWLLVCIASYYGIIPADAGSTVPQGDHDH